MNYELFINLLNVVFAFGSNNWLSVVISILLFFYNIYNKIRKQNLLSLVINNQKENITAGQKVSTIFKIKFIIYTIISIYALCFAILHFFDEMNNYGLNFKIFNRNEKNEEDEY